MNQNKNKTYVFDLDGTLCEEVPTFEKSLAFPKMEIINFLKKLYQDGHRIIIYTARSWSEYKMTQAWLEEHQVPYHLLMCGKVLYDYWIDDRALQVDEIKDLI